MSASRIASAHQPHFLPWLRYVEKALRCDVFIVLDNVQFVKGGWQNRTRIKGPSGWHYLTVPVEHRFPQLLDEVAIDNRREWRGRHVKSLRASYGRSPHFVWVMSRLEAVYAAHTWALLNDFNLALLEVIWELAGCTSRLVRSSALPAEGRSTLRLAGLCTAVGATHYLTGAHAAQEYLDPELLQAAGVGTLVQSWLAPGYPQVHPKAGFVPDLSVVDMLMMMGPATREALLEAGQPGPYPLAG